MDYDEAAKSLKDIKATMGRSSTRLSREPGWFFVIAGAMWLIGYLVTQFAPAVAGPAWLVVTVLGCGAMTALGVFLRKKKGGARMNLPPHPFSFFFFTLSFRCNE